MNKARDAWKKVQQILGTRQDGIPGPIDEHELLLLKLGAKHDFEWNPGEPDTTPTTTAGWHEGKASSFADPADIRAFKRCKATGKSDSECFRVGDNGVGKWGTDTTQDRPMVALPREDWAHLPNPQGTPVIVEVGNNAIRATLEDTMPARANIRNGAIIDLNPAACAALGLTPPVMVNARWRWA